MNDGVWPRRVRRVLTYPVGIPASALSFVWARREITKVKRVLRSEGTDTRVATPSRRWAPLAPRGYWGVHTAMWRLGPTCLERALILQAWFSVRRPPPDVIIGVRKGAAKFEAHAWLDRSGDPWHDESYDEFARLPFASPVRSIADEQLATSD